ncbi:MAG: CbiX/SirB N-terminal domain-containing protein [Candidatus Nitrosocaldus sp.]|nr:sirohydrochlorin cobaltochelatase [Candidatus Nitrosocaldus sp.]MDW8275801.1 CbiX/SirB N-terminal domain-containing protein [Candidatus Nitrosocaldus sp.]
MKRGILLIDRGSNDPDVLIELAELCSMVEAESRYDHATYALLEVTSPTIEDALLESLGYGVEHVTIVPYFLYPGMKMKAAVSKGIEGARMLGIGCTVTDCLNYHDALIELVRARVDEARAGSSMYSEAECDLLLIGHGSSDKDARRVFRLIGERLKPYYRNLGICFLELDEPNIGEGIKAMLAGEPRMLILMPYFLHNGEHMKHDIREEVDAALEEFRPSCTVVMARHLGTDRRMVRVIMDRIREAEMAGGAGDHVGR